MARCSWPLFNGSDLFQAALTLRRRGTESQRLRQFPGLQHSYLLRSSQLVGFGRPPIFGIPHAHPLCLSADKMWTVSGLGGDMQRGLAMKPATRHQLDPSVRSPETQDFEAPYGQRLSAKRKARRLWVTCTRSF